MSPNKRHLKQLDGLRGNLCDSHIFPRLYTDDEEQSYDTRNWAMPFTLSL
jgi:hypothetical protein